MMDLHRLPRRFAPRNDGVGGFTFIELLVVITIVGIIFAAAAVAYGAVTVRSRDARRKTDLELIRQALEMCRSISGSYPTADIYTEGGISCGASGPVTLLNVPVDPKPANACSYTYNRIDATTYSLSACMETDSSTYTVNSP